MGRVFSIVYVPNRKKLKRARATNGKVRRKGLTASFLQYQNNFASSKRRSERAVCVAEYSLLLMMNAVLGVAWATVLMQGKAHDFPGSRTSSCDKHGEESSE